MAEVFVNYRNGDGDAIAEMIAMYLSRRFGKEHVFKASRSIPPGSDYRDALLGGVRECSVLLAVMGPDWPHLERLRDPGDWVRAEIVEALAANKSIVPVLYGRRTEQLRAADLPQELVRLAYANSLRIDTRNGEADLERISQAVIDLVPSLKDVDQSTGPSTEQGTTHNSATQVSGPVIQGNDVGGDQMNVSGTHGPSQLGHGNTQNNFLGVRFRAVQLRRQSLKGLSWLRERFVPPPGFDAAAAILAEHDPDTAIAASPAASYRNAARSACGCYRAGGHLIADQHPRGLGPST